MSTARLYSLSLSHPGMCVRLALERKGVGFRLTNLLPGMHPPIVRVLGFKRNTVPALKIDGMRVQGSREITAYLEQTRPEPALFGRSPEERERIEEAERWGDEELQDVPRTIFRYCAVNQPEVLRWLAKENGFPLPRLTGPSGKPVAVIMARAQGATEEQVRSLLEALPSMLDRIDALIADGTIGASQPNAADFQILATIRVLGTFEDLAPLLADRPAMAAARRIVPEMPGPVPVRIPAEWMPAPALDSSQPRRGR